MPDDSRIQAIIVGSERGVRRLDPTQSYPHALSALSGINDRQSVLEWTLAALAHAGVRDRLFVGGYHIQKVVAKFPSLRFAFHQSWEREGAVGGLVVGLESAAPGASLVLVMGDVVLRPSAINARIENGFEARSVGVGLVRVDVGD